MEQSTPSVRVFAFSLFVGGDFSASRSGRWRSCRSNSNDIQNHIHIDINDNSNAEVLNLGGGEAAGVPPGQVGEGQPGQPAEGGSNSYFDYSYYCSCYRYYYCCFKSICLCLVVWLFPIHNSERCARRRCGPTRCCWCRSRGSGHGNPKSHPRPPTSGFPPVEENTAKHMKLKNSLAAGIAVWG